MTEQQSTALETLQSCQAFLLSCRKEMEAARKDPHVRQWEKINFDQFSHLFLALNIPTDLNRASRALPKVSKELQKIITRLDNDINNLLAEIKLGGKAESTVMKEARRIESHCRQDTAEMLKQLTQYRTMLHEATCTLQENFTMHSLVPLVREQLSGKKRNLFDSGYEVYLIINGEQDREIETTNLINMHTFFDQAAAWQKKITEYEMPELAPIAAGLMEQQFSLCQEGLAQVKLTVNLLASLFGKEAASLDEFKQHISQLTTKGVTEMLNRIPDLTNELSACLRNFAAKKFLLQELEKVELLAENCQQFFNDISTQFIPFLQQEMAKERNILNPQTLATSRAKSYFKGMRGIWRIIRMIYKGLAGSPLISQQQLQEILAKALHDCHIFFTDQGKDAAQLHHYIKEPFRDFSSPFPAKELSSLLQRTLLTYTAVLQKVFFRFRATYPDSDRKPPRLGRLSTKIEVGIEYLQNYQKKTEKMLE